MVTDLYHTQADDDAVMPYIVMQLVNGQVDQHATEKNFTEDVLVQFNIFDNRTSMGGATGTMVILDALFTCYDFAALSVSGYYVEGCVRENTTQTKVEDVWQINVTYRIKIRKT